MFQFVQITFVVSQNTFHWLLWLFLCNYNEKKYKLLQAYTLKNHFKVQCEQKVTWLWKGQKYFLNTKAFQAVNRISAWLLFQVEDFFLQTFQLSKCWLFLICIRMYIKWIFSISIKRIISCKEFFFLIWFCIFE